MKPTDQQAAIVDAARTGEDLIVEAGAGTGKTSTLKLLAADRPHKRGLYLAYNKAVAAEAAATFPRNTRCKTAHSLAFQTVGRQYAHRLNGARLTSRDNAEIFDRLNPAAVALGTEHLHPPALARVAMDTVQMFCQSADHQIDRTHVPHVPGVSDKDRPAVEAAAVLLASTAWNDLNSVFGELRFEHDHYLKMWQLTCPELPFDVVMLDEAQDANPVVQAVVDQQTHAQRIAVGDQSQAIYGWRGAVDAMQVWQWRRLALTQSFRFGPAVAEQANLWLNWLDAPLRLDGSPHLDTLVGWVDQPDAILTRGNVSGFIAAVDQLDEGLAVGIVGGVTDIKRLAWAARDLQAGRRTDNPELCAFNTWEDVRDYTENDAEGADLKTFVRLVDRRGPAFILAVVDSFTPETRAQVVVSTAHKAKGREWGRVQIGDDFPEPKVDEHGNEQDITREDAMLAYVAVTRAQAQLDTGSLNWINKVAL